LSSSPQEIGNENIDGSSTGQNWTVWFAKSDNPFFSNRIKLEQNRKKPKS
jgi:hypothetical protein